MNDQPAAHTGRWLAVSAGILALAIFGSAPATAQTKITDKWITVVLPSEPQNIEPCHSNKQLMGHVVKFNINEPLIQKDTNDGSLQPRLATSWEQVDPNTWRIKLRTGVKFHDGTPFDATAAKTSIERNWSKPLACGDMSKFFGGVTLDISVADASTLLIKTAQPEPILPMRLTGLVIAGPDTPLDKTSLAPIGTGPYAFDSWQPGQQILLKRFDGYWGPKPKVEGVRYVWRTESSVRAAMVKIGEADIAPSIAPQDATDRALDHGYLNSEKSFLRLDTTMAPLNDRRVRVAMHHALDLNSMPGTLLPKEVVRATQIVFPSIPGHNHEIDKRLYVYDPVKAKQLLSEAKADGVPVDSEITMISSGYLYPNAVEVAEASTTMFNAVGLNVKLSILEVGQYAKWSNKPFPENRGPSILQSGHDNNFGDPVFSAYLRYSCNGTTSMFCDPDLDKDISRVTALGGEDRVKGWQELFRHIHEDLVPYVMMFHMISYARVNPRVNYVPDVTTYAGLRAEDISFK